ncbi:MAG: glycosyltransferase family 1 protein, partial [Deltaproteobacteria bacterium]
CFLSSKVILVADALAFRFPDKTQKEKCVTIHNGVDLQRFVPLTRSNLKPCNPYFESQSILVAHSGRVEPQKGQRQLIEACGRLRDLVPGLRIVFAGEIKDDAYFQGCLQSASSLGVRERIRFIGHQEDVIGLLQASDIFVMPSIKGEAFSRALLEAMAMGKPVIATTCGGSVEAFEENSSGFSVPPEDSAALAEKIALLSSHQELRSQIGRAARNRVEACFGIEKNVERTVHVYAEVLRGRL